MNRDAIRQVVATVEARLDRETAARLAAIPEDPHARAIFERERWGGRMPWEGFRDPGKPTLPDVGDAVWVAVKRRDPGAIVYEPADGHDSGGPTLFGGPWYPASREAIYAAAYSCPGLFPPEEHRILTRSWEAVFGPPQAP